MKFAVNFVRVRPEAVIEVARRAEARGYDSVFMPDHVVLPATIESRYPGGDGSFPYPTKAKMIDPWVALSHISAVTTELRLGMAIYNLPLRNPFLTARAGVSLDVMSGGRLLLGVGLGWLREEYEAMGVDFRTRAGAADETIEVLRKLWTDETPEHAGPRFPFGPVHFEPKPVSRPHPPILVGGDSHAAMRRAARLGDGWIGGGHATTPDDVREQIEELRRYRADSPLADRPFEITVSAGSWVKPDDVPRFEEMGVDRLIVIPWRRSSEALEAVDRFADEVIDQVATHTA